MFLNSDGKRKGDCLPSERRNQQKQTPGERPKEPVDQSFTAEEWRQRPNMQTGRI